MHTFPMPVPVNELIPIAVRAARGDRALADEALLHLQVQVWRGVYDPTRPFRGWAATVLYNCCASELRLRIRAVGGDAPFPEVADHRSAPAASETALDLSTHFCPDDLRVVRGWKPRPRLVLLGWYGLWDKLLLKDQKDTLDAVAPAVPFPVPDFFDWPAKDRTRYLAQVLRCPPNSVAQLRLREADRLTALRFVRELQLR